MTPFPIRPADVVPLTVLEFTFVADLTYAPSLADVCARFADDANRAYVWLLRFHALQTLTHDGRMLPAMNGTSGAARRVFEVAASHALNERWEFDARAFFAAVNG